MENFEKLDKKLDVFRKHKLGKRKKMMRRVIEAPHAFSIKSSHVQTKRLLTSLKNAKGKDVFEIFIDRTRNKFFGHSNKHFKILSQPLSANTSFFEPDNELLLDRERGNIYGTRGNYLRFKHLSKIDFECFLKDWRFLESIDAVGKKSVASKKRFRFRDFQLGQFYFFHYNYNFYPFFNYCYFYNELPF